MILIISNVFADEQACAQIVKKACDDGKAQNCWQALYCPP